MTKLKRVFDAVLVDGESPSTNPLLYRIAAFLKGDSKLSKPVRFLLKARPVLTFFCFAFSILWLYKVASSRGESFVSSTVATASYVFMFLLLSWLSLGLFISKVRVCQRCRYYYPIVKKCQLEIRSSMNPPRTSNSTGDGSVKAYPAYRHIRNKQRNDTCDKWHNDRY